MFHSREPGRWTIRRLLSLTVVALACRGVAAEETGYPKEISIREPTRLDWVFAVANRSVLDPPAEWLQGYGSAMQRYELLVPATAKKKPKTKTKNKTADALPLVLFISAGDQSAGWSQVQVVCPTEWGRVCQSFWNWKQHADAAEHPQIARRAG